MKNYHGWPAALAWIPLLAEAFFYAFAAVAFVAMLIWGLLEWFFSHFIETLSVVAFVAFVWAIFTGEFVLLLAAAAVYVIGGSLFWGNNLIENQTAGLVMLAFGWLSGMIGAVGLLHLGWLDVFVYAVVFVGWVVFLSLNLITVNWLMKR